MYFQWRSTPYGIIRISCDGLSNFVGQAIRSRLRLYSVTLLPSSLTLTKNHEPENDKDKNEAELSIVFADDDLQPEIREKIEDHYKSILQPMGILSAVIWAAPEKGIAHILQNSWTWAGVASCLAIITTAGFDGFFWTAFWGSAAWFTMRALTLITRLFRGA